MGKSFECILLLAFILVGLSEQLDVTFPGTNVTFTTNSTEAVYCKPIIMTFQSYFSSAPSQCQSLTVSEASWLNYKRGFNATGYDLGVSYDNCTNVNVTEGNSSSTSTSSSTASPNSRALLQRAQCDYVRRVAEASQNVCDALPCYIDSINVQLQYSRRCFTIGQRMCLGLQPAVAQVVPAAISEAADSIPLGVPPLVYDSTKINISCDPAQCRLLPLSGAYRVSPVAVAFVVVLGSVLSLL